MKPDRQHCCLDVMFSRVYGQRTSLLFACVCIVWVFFFNYSVRIATQVGCAVRAAKCLLNLAQQSCADCPFPDEWLNEFYMQCDGDFCVCMIKSGWPCMCFCVSCIPANTKVDSP